MERDNVWFVGYLCGQIWYKDWEFSVTEHVNGRALKIIATAPDTRRLGSERTPRTSKTTHYFTIPMLSMMLLGELERWILDCVLLVERHDTLETFKIDGKAVFFPSHVEGTDLYAIERKYGP